MDGRITIRIKMMEGAEELKPHKTHHDDAAYDLKSRIDIELKPGEPHLVPTGIFMEIPHGYEAQVRPRSGLALKHALTVLNSPGTIDSGYRGEVGVIMLNAGKSAYAVKRGDRIAQMVIGRLPDVKLDFVNELSETGRGAGGFGSTGKN